MPIEPNKLIVINNPFNQRDRTITPIDYDPGRTLLQLVKSRGVNPDDYAIIKNGSVAGPAELDNPLMPGDMVHVMPIPANDDMRSIGMLAVAVIAYYYVGPAASGYLQGAGMSAGAAQVWGAIAATAVVTAGGMLINGNMPNPAQRIGGSNKENSPTYGWSVADNTAQEGIAIPVIYGNEVTYPQIINQWVECRNMYGTDATHEQWWHVLLSIAEGKTNTVPTADDIKVGDMPLTYLDAASYAISTSDGNEIGRALPYHDKLHQLVGINKELVIASLSQILLHFNGDDASTDIIEDGVGTGGNYKIPGETGSTNTWTAAGSAALSNDNPFIGSAALELPAASYITVDNWRAMALWTEPVWDFECRFRQSSLTDCCIASQEWVDSGVKRYCWGIHYNAAGAILFQQFSKDEALGTYEIFINLSAAASLSIDTWHHIRVARVDSAVYIFLDGVLLDSDTFAVTPEYAAGDIETTGALNVGDTYYIEDCVLGHFYYRSEAGDTFEAESATTIDASNTVRNVSTGTFAQGLGFGKYYNGATDAARSGNMQLDETRMRFKELIYDSVASYTPPTNQIADDNEQIYFTRGAIDGFYVNISNPYGLYFQDVDGLDNAACEFWISWRQVGSTTWERVHWGWLEFSRDPIMFQRYFAPTAGRGSYEIRVTRVTWQWALDYADTQFQTASFLSSIDEVLNESLKYPYLQTLRLSIKAQEKLSGRVPPIRVESNRTSIVVPTYDGLSKRSVNPTNNANAVFDMFTNRIYGIGQDADRIIEADWDEWVDWCDGDVDGYSRCSVNMVFDADASFDEALQHVEACGRARVVNRGSKVSVVIDKPTDSTDLFCNENITPGTDKVTWLRQAERSDAVEIVYRNQDKNFADDSEFYPGTGYYTLTRVPRVTRLTMLGIKSQEQARREAILRQQISESIKRALSLQSGLESLKVMPGDVFDYASKGNIMAFTGRLARGAAREEQYTGYTAYLDKGITLDTATYDGNCIMIVRNADDSISEYTVTGPFDVETWSVTVIPEGTFDFLAPWIIGRPTEKLKYKVRTVSRGNKMDAAIEAQQYDEDAYYNANYDSGGTPI